MGTSEVVVHVVERDHRCMVLDLLGEGVGQPGEPPHAHPHREVLALEVVDFLAERGLDGLQVRGVAVRRELHAVGEPTRVPVAPSDVPPKDEL